MRALAQLALLAALPALAGRGWWCAEGEVVSVTECGRGGGGRGGGGGGPEFVALGDTSVVAAVGQDAHFDCRVLRLADKAVSWVRSRDLQILSHAGSVFTADARVSVSAGGGGGGGGGGARHTLRIRDLRVSDAGCYECQLNTEPKMSRFYNLTVLDEPVGVGVIAAVGARAVHAARGGAATLACEARYEPPPRALPLPPLTIRWAKDGRPLMLQGGGGGGGGGGGVLLDTERWAARALSRLTLAALAPADAGRYSCQLQPAGVEDAVHLYVDSESQMEAMQRDQSPGNGAPPPPPPPAAALAALLPLLLRMLFDT